MADVVEETEDRPTHYDPSRRWRARVKRDDTQWADGYGATENEAEADAVQKLDALPDGYTGKFS